MKKIHRVSYGNIFAREFKTNSIDNRLNDLELDEKLMIIDNVIDYLHVNFKELSPDKRYVRNKSLGNRGEEDDTTDMENAMQEQKLTKGASS